MSSKLLAGILCWFVVFQVSAETQTLDLDAAIERALNHDPRISELEAMVRAARELVNEVKGEGGLQVSAKAFMGFSPGLDGGLFETEECGNGQACTNRRDRYTLEDGLSLWNYMDYSIIQPLYTFGKLSSYVKATEANVDIQQETVKLQSAETIVEVKKAYYGHLTARDTGLFLKDMKGRLQTAANKVRNWLDEGEGHVKQTDLYALKAAIGIANSYIAQAKALEEISLAGLHVLTNIEKDIEIVLTDKRISPAPLPKASLEELQQQALRDRPEMAQLENGLKARRALVAGHKSLNYPDLFVGISGMLSYSPGRDRLDNPHIYDPFNDVGTTPIVGMRWRWYGQLNDAKASRAQAELEALIEKGTFARRGIPFQVEESYTQVMAFHESVAELEQSSRSARRWMIATYTDFEAGVEQADKIVTAFQAYVLAYTEYLRTVYEYNMHVAQLQSRIGVIN